jgi:hypothetical protein
MYVYIGLFLGSLFGLEYVANMFLRNVGISPNYMSNIQGAVLQHLFEKASQITGPSYSRNWKLTRASCSNVKREGSDVGRSSQQESIYGFVRESEGGGS